MSDMYTALTATRIQTTQGANNKYVYELLAFLSTHLNAVEHFIQKMKQTLRLYAQFMTNEWETLNQIMHRPQNEEPERSGQGSESLSVSVSTKAVDLLKANQTQHGHADRGTRISLENPNLSFLQRSWSRGLLVGSLHTHINCRQLYFPPHDATE
jgi:hypothetical protein